MLDSRAMQRFVGVDLMGEQVPDATTLLKFRRILEDDGLQDAMFSELNRLLDSAGIMMRGGSIVDATFIESPSSTKNARKERDPEAHQGKKGKSWHFGYKAHFGVDPGQGRAALPRGEAPVRLGEDPLPRARQELRAGLHVVRVGQPRTRRPRGARARSAAFGGAGLTARLGASAPKTAPGPT